MIALDGVSKSFAAPVLCGVSLAIPVGALYGIIGPGGSGKSVLCKCVVGLVAPDSGSVSIGDDVVTSLDEIRLHEVRKRVGMLFQNNALFDYLNVGENVAFPLRRLFHEMDEDALRGRVAERIGRVGLGGFEPRAPGGLSGGQKKRVGIARATVTAAPIVIYDEPTAGLDPVTSQRIYDLLRAEQRAAGATVIVVSSDVAGLLTVCDRVGMLVRGALVFDGTVDELLASTVPIVKQVVRGETDGPL